MVRNGGPWASLVTLLPSFFSLVEFPSEEFDAVIEKDLCLNSNPLVFLYLHKRNHTTTQLSSNIVITSISHLRLEAIPELSFSGNLKCNYFTIRGELSERTNKLSPGASGSQKVSNQRFILFQLGIGRKPEK
ncbi:hypothetical protein SDJN02_12182, partial [Cucurbita argyrosperma subsp. argyrosperma]